MNWLQAGWASLQARRGGSSGRRHTGLFREAAPTRVPEGGRLLPAPIRSKCWLDMLTFRVPFSPENPSRGPGPRSCVLTSAWLILGHTKSDDSIGASLVNCNPRPTTEFGKNHRKFSENQLAPWNLKDCYFICKSACHSAFMSASLMPDACAGAPSPRGRPLDTHWGRLLPDAKEGMPRHGVASVLSAGMRRPSCHCL